MDINTLCCCIHVQEVSTLSAIVWREVILYTHNQSYYIPVINTVKRVSNR